MHIVVEAAHSLSDEEKNYRTGKKNELLARLQFQLGKTRDQVLELFRYYNNLPK